MGRRTRATDHEAYTKDALVEFEQFHS